MDYNRFSYYRANPFAHNDFIPQASMTNRKPKEFPSQIPQGEQHLTSRPGRRIFKQKVQTSEIQKNNILKSPQRYPFENRIALNKQFKRNLETVDIEGAAAGTKVSESVRNKFKALQVLKQKEKGVKQQVLTKSRLIGQSLDAVYQKKRRQLAVQMSKNIETRKSSGKLRPNQYVTNDIQQTKQTDRFNASKLPQKITDEQYKRYIAHNSNQKYTGISTIPHQFDGKYQRYKRQQQAFQSFQGAENNKEIQIIDKNNSQSKNNLMQTNNQTNNRGYSIDSLQNNLNKNTNSFGNHNNNGQIHSILNSPINPSNRYRSNPEYMETYSKEHHKRMEEIQKTKQIENTLQQTFANNKRQFRRNNPTNLSFNIAARSSLMSTII